MIKKLLNYLILYKIVQEEELLKKLLNYLRFLDEKFLNRFNILIFIIQIC